MTLLLAVGVSAIEPHLLRKSVDGATFDRMAAAELRLHEKLGVKDTVPSRRRMRKGKVGGYADEVSEEDPDPASRRLLRRALLGC